MCVLLPCGGNQPRQRRSAAAGEVDQVTLRVPSNPSRCMTVWSFLSHPLFGGFGRNAGDAASALLECYTHITPGAQKGEASVHSLCFEHSDEDWGLLDRWGFCGALKALIIHSELFSSITVLSLGWDVIS